MMQPDRDKDQLVVHETDELDELLQRGFRYAMALTHHASQAEDLVQEACLKLLNRGMAIELPVLFTTIRNHFIDLYRHAKRFPKDSLDETNVVELDLSFFASRHDDRVADKDMLARSLGRLSMEEREALYLWAVEGYTANEIAKIGSLSRNTVLSRLQRTRGKLRDMLQDIKIEVAP